MAASLRPLEAARRAIIKGRVGTTVKIIGCKAKVHSVTGAPHCKCPIKGKSLEATDFTSRREGPVLIFLLVVKVGVVESDSVTYHLEVGEFE